MNDRRIIEELTTPLQDRRIDIGFGKFLECKGRSCQSSSFAKEGFLKRGGTRHSVETPMWHELEIPGMGPKALMRTANADILLQF